MTKVLYLLNNGVEFTAQEATDLFFAATKLFQSQDPILRRMTYLVLKELTPYAKDVIIVCASLTKDMNSKNNNYRANAIRALCCAVDDMALLGQQGDRLLKQAVVDKDPYVSTSALVSAYHLSHVSPQNQEIIKRWLQEVSEASKNTQSNLVSYHALGLLYRIRKHDRLAVSRLAAAKASQQSSGYASPFETCLFIRIAASLIRETGPENSAPLVKFLQECKHGHSMVKFEAAKAICDLEDILPTSVISVAVSMLTSVLSGSKPAVRVSALRILNRVKANVTASFHELDALVSDSNLSVATLAISMLLKTGAESSIETHLKTLTNFMLDISDEFKCNVADGIKGLCFKYPRKKTVLLSFLAKSLRDDGQYEYKSKVVDTMMQIMQELPETKDETLLHLCEFIEDCEYTDLACRILYTLGEEGPSTKGAHKYIRYIFNRIILENPAVRCAAVQSLAKYGRNCPSLHGRVCLLLKRCFGDSHAVVRDSALLQYKILQNSELNNYTDGQLGVPVENLVQTLKNYLGDGTSTPFDINTVPKKVKQQPKKQDQKTSASAASPAVTATYTSYAEQLAKVPELTELGRVISSSKLLPLTESETEYTVGCIKHMFAEHIVLQFDCNNTLEDQLLENVSVKVEIEDGEFEVVDEIPLESLPYDTIGTTYVIIQKEPESNPVGTLSCTLKFTAKEIDTASGDVDENGYEDEYQLEEIEITIADYMAAWTCPNPQGLWEELGVANQNVEKYALNTFKTLEQACKEIATFLNMTPCGQTNYQPGVSSKAKHLLFLSGKFLGDTQVIARSRMKLNPSGGVAMELTVRSQNSDVNVALCNAL